MKKKEYTPPTLTDHGSVVQTTKGLIGFSLEPLGELIHPDHGDGFAPEPKEKK